MLKDGLVKLRLPEQKKQLWFQQARRRGETLSVYVERAVDEAIALENALELQVEDERRRQEQRALEEV